MSRIVGIKRRYHETFGSEENPSDSYLCREYYPSEPAAKKLREQEQRTFYISLHTSDDSLRLGNFVGVFHLDEVNQPENEDYRSLLRRTDSLEITDFAFHNPVSSHQAIKILSASNEVITRFTISGITFEDQLRERQPREQQPYAILYQHLKQEKCIGVAPAGEKHLFLLYASPNQPFCINAILLKKFYFVIDLDDTLVKSRIPKEPFEEPTPEETVFQVGPHRVYTKVLENVQPFLKWADRLFHIVFVTNSIFLYASNIVRILDPNRTNFLSRVRGLDQDGLSEILKHRGDLICVLSQVESINNDIGVDNEEQGTEKYDNLTEDEDEDDDEEEYGSTEKKDQNHSDSPSKRKRKGFGGIRNCNQPPPQTGYMKGQEEEQQKENDYVCVPPPPQSQNKTKVPENQPERSVNRGNRPKFIFIKDLETLGLPVHRSVVIDDQKHVWARNQFNCLPFPTVNDGNGLRMKELKNETFKKIMELQLRLCYQVICHQKE